jgi:hypothetical protein
MIFNIQFRFGGRYLTVPYYLGLLYAKVNKMEERAQSIIKAKVRCKRHVCCLRRF